MLGYTRFNNIDHCIYLQQCGDNFVYIAVWVDDLLFVCYSQNSLQTVKSEISSEFEATDQGDPRHLLGIEITHNHDASEIKISQGQFLCKILSRFGMEDSHSVTTPMENSNHLIPAVEDNLFENPSLYHTAIGSLMYPAIGTRPDLALQSRSSCNLAMPPRTSTGKQSNKFFAMWRVLLTSVSPTPVPKTPWSSLKDSPTLTGHPIAWIANRSLAMYSS